MQTWLKSLWKQVFRGFRSICVCLCERHKDSWHVRLSSESSYSSSRGAALALTAGRSGRQGDRMGVSLRRRFRCAIDGRRMIKERKRKKSSERSCFSNATVSYCICKENGLLIDPHTRRLMHMHALRRAHIRAEHTQKWCFCAGSSCDGRDARQQWHFCCHKQFSFHNRKNQI